MQVRHCGRSKPPPSPVLTNLDASASNPSTVTAPTDEWHFKTSAAPVVLSPEPERGSDGSQLRLNKTSGGRGVERERRMERSRPQPHIYPESSKRLSLCLRTQSLPANIKSQSLAHEISVRSTTGELILSRRAEFNRLERGEGQIGGYEFFSGGKMGSAAFWECAALQSLIRDNVCLCCDLPPLDLSLHFSLDGRQLLRGDE